MPSRKMRLTSSASSPLDIPHCAWSEKLWVICTSSATFQAGALSSVTSTSMLSKVELTGSMWSRRTQKALCHACGQ